MEDGFINAFAEIDSSGSGEISINELTAYMQQNNYEQSFVEKWQQLFDKENTGVITLSNFCQVLGLEFEATKAKMDCAHQKSLPDDVCCLAGDMSLDWQLVCVDVMREAFNQFSSVKDIAKHIKTMLDQRIEPLFHVVIVQGQFWCWYTHEPGYSFTFKFGRHIFIIWKTPAM